MLRRHCEMIKRETEANFINLETAVKTYDRNALVCGSPAWRYIYHTIHSADKWFFNPFVYKEPDFHQEGMDDPDTSCSVELSDEQLLAYLKQVKTKTMDYLDSLTDEELYQSPENCPYSRLELAFRQFRHLSYHTGLINGQTIERTGKFPVFVGPETVSRLDKGLFDE